MHVIPFKLFNPLTSRSDKHVPSPYDIQYIIQQADDENTQTSEVEVVI